MGRANCKIEDCKDVQYDAICCPGGMPGASALSECTTLIDMLKAQQARGGVTAAVCASPAVVFAPHGLLGGKATCYPAPKFKDVLGDKLQDGDVVTDGNVITSKGPGTSLLFALQVVEALYGKEKADEIG